MSKIVEAIEKNKFSYKEIRQRSVVSLLDDAEYTINVIIGFRGRPEFYTPLIDSFHKAFDYYHKKHIDSRTFCLTFVEHSDAPAAKTKLDGIVNYLWTPGNVTDQYSRSFAYNFGVKYSNKAKYYLLHDLDILVKENFFDELFINLGDSKCMQTYGKRRVLYLSEELTKKVISNEADYNTFSEITAGVSPPSLFGSKGGSIVVEHDLYYQIGGFDPEVFWGYAAEDQVFWEKILTVYGDTAFADNPPIDMFHMWHPPSHMSNPLLYPMEECFIEFKGMKKSDRLAVIKMQHNTFSMNDIKPYIFTEAFNCGLILKRCLETFFTYHPDMVVHVIGTHKDFKELGKFPNVDYIEMSADNDLQECFKHGHLGTGHIFARVIRELADSDHIIHFDSDVVFREECVSLLVNKLSEGFDLVGPYRCYKNNANGRTDLGVYSDVTQTYFFGFNKTKISSSFEFSTFRLMCTGLHNPLGHPILDFFDPVEFNILSNGGTICFLDPDDVGGLLSTGKRENKYPDLNKDMDFGNKLMHFAGVGSGMKFYYKGADHASQGYVDWALRRFALYSWVVFDKKLDNFTYDTDLENKYSLLKNA